MPPLVTTDFVAVDEGNASPRLMRSTIYNVPTTADLLKTAHLPFAITLTPFAKADEGEVRLSKCPTFCYCYIVTCDRTGLSCTVIFNLGCVLFHECVIILRFVYA